MYKYVLVLLTVISFQLFAEDTKYVSVSQNSRNYTIPIPNNLTPEQILNNYRPTGKKDETEGSWNKDKTRYSYKSFSVYRLCYNTGFGCQSPIGYGLKNERGSNLESLVAEIRQDCSDENWKTTNVEYNDDKTGVQYTLTSCNSEDGEKPKEKKLAYVITKEVDDIKLKIKTTSHFLESDCATATCATGEDLGSTVGNPINVLNGYKIETSVDFNHKNFPIIRTYNSEYRYDENIVGNGWHFNFELKIITNEDGTYSFYESGKTQKIVDNTIPEDINTLFIKKEEHFLIIKNNHILRFNKDGYIESIKDFQGYGSNFEYKDNILSKINTQNGSYELAYDADTKMLSQIKTPNDGILKYTLKEQNLKLNVNESKGYVLESYTDLLDYTVTYTMSDDYLLLTRTNKQGELYAQWEYDEDGRGIKSSHGDYDQVRISYDDRDNTRRVDSNDGRDEFTIENNQLTQKNDVKLESKNETSNFKIEYLNETGYGSNLNTLSLNKNTNQSIEKEYTNENDYGYYQLKSFKINDIEIIYFYENLILIKEEYLINSELIKTKINNYDELNRLTKIIHDKKIIKSYSYIGQTFNISNIEKNKKTTYENYNLFGIPEVVIIDGFKITFKYDDMGRSHIISSINGAFEYTLDGEGNELSIKEIDKKGKESLIIQTFDPYSHLITKEYKGYKMEYDYYDDNKIRSVETFFNGEKIEDQDISYDGDIIKSISSINSAKKEYSIEKEDDKTEEYYNIDNVRYDIFKNSDGLVEKIEMARQEIISHQYNENITVTKTANNILILETEMDNKKTTFSNDMGETKVLIKDNISKINRNGNEFTNKIEEGKIIEHKDVADVSTLYSYGEEELFKITKNDNFIEFTNKDDVYFITSKNDSKTDILEYSNNYLIYPSGNRITYSFDKNDQLTGIKFNEKIITRDMVSNGGNDFKSFEYGNGIKVEKEFKGLNLEESVHKGVFTEEVDLRYGRITAIDYKSEDSKYENSYNFYYDDKNQIKEMRIRKDNKDRIEVEQLFDENQNIISNFNKEIFKYKKNSNQLSDKTKYNYDLSGNMTKIDDLTIVYNYKNHIKNVLKEGELIAEYDYNLLNQRSKAFYPKENITKYFYYDHMGRMIEEKIGEEIKSFIYLNYKIIGYHYKGELYFNHYSAENTIKAETNSKGEAKYFDYGFDSDINEASILYYGQYKDEFTGLYYNYNRDYSHKLKRYLQIDPLYLKIRTNSYIYAENNLVNHFDFYGLDITLNMLIKVKPEGKRQKDYIIGDHNIFTIDDASYLKGEHVGLEIFSEKDLSVFIDTNKEYKHINLKEGLFIDINPVDASKIWSGFDVFDRYNTSGDSIRLTEGRDGVLGFDFSEQEIKEMEEVCRDDSLKKHCFELKKITFKIKENQILELLKGIEHCRANGGYDLLSNNCGDIAACIINSVSNEKVNRPFIPSPIDYLRKNKD